MKQELLENLIIDYLNGELDAQGMDKVETLIKSNQEAKMMLAEYKSIFKSIEVSNEEMPPESLKHDFHNFLNGEFKAQNLLNEKGSSKKINYFKNVFIVLGLLCIGLLVGFFMNSQKTNYSKETHHFAENPQKENLLNLLKQKSTSHRIKAVNMSTYMDDDDGILDALIRTFLTDKSEHVRLACIESLSKYTKEDKVREAFIYALEQETDPTIQISLIQVLSEIKEQKAMESFDKIIENDNSVNFVRDEAYSGKLKLITTY